MPQIRNVSPYGPLDTPLLQHVDITDLAAVVEVSDEQARVLLAQFDNWAPVDKAAVAIAADCVAEQQQRQRDDVGEPAPDALKPEWVAFAVKQGDPDAQSSTKAQLVAKHGTQLDTPADVASALAERGNEIAAAVESSTTPPPPPGGDPGQTGDGTGDDPDAGAAGGDDKSGDDQ